MGYRRGLRAAVIASDNAPSPAVVTWVLDHVRGEALRRGRALMEMISEPSAPATVQAREWAAANGVTLIEPDPDFDLCISFGVSEAVLLVVEHQVETLVVPADPVFRRQMSRRRSHMLAGGRARMVEIRCFCGLNLWVDQWHPGPRCWCCGAQVKGTPDRVLSGHVVQDRTADFSWPGRAPWGYPFDEAAAQEVAEADVYGFDGGPW